MIAVIRNVCKSSNTGDRLNSIIAAIRDPRVTQVTLYATPTSRTADYSDMDGLEANLPEVAALATGSFIGDAPIDVVFDGAFLSATRYPRYAEVRTLLDEAEKSGKVYFSAERVPFTARKSEADAAAIMHMKGRLTLLTNQTRAKYFSLLSNITEEEYKKL